MSRKPPVVMMAAALASVSLVGCLSSPSGGGSQSVPHLHAATTGAAPLYHQGLIDPEWDPLARGGDRVSSRSRRSRQPLLARCRRLADRQLGATSTAAQQELLRVCLGRTVAIDIQVRRSPAPRALDLVLFDETRPSAEQGIGRLTGIVLASSGDKVEFLYIRGTRAHLGVLNLRNPDSRRDARGTLANTYLRMVLPGDAPGTRYLAGQLLAGFAPAPWNSPGL